MKRIENLLFFTKAACPMAICLCTLFAYVLAPIFGAAQSVSDPHFRVVFEQPLYPANSGPSVLYDMQHYNAVSLSGQYKGFADVLEADGYRLQNQSAPINSDALSNAKVFVTVNALSDPDNWDLPNPSIYTVDEIEALYRWVHDEGGGLFIITDQMPSAGAVGALASRFGFNLINGVTHRLDGQVELFNRTAGNLLPSAVTDMLDREVHQIRCWGGSGFIPPLEAEVFSILGDAYRIYLPSKVKDVERTISDTIPYITGTHIANGAILLCGKGKVCVFSDASPFTAMLRGINSTQRGMNHPDARDHINLLRNIMQWLHR